MLKTVVTASMLVGAMGCAGSFSVEKPQNPVVNQAIDTMWEKEIARVAQSGDWILTKSYSMTGEIISAATSGETLSHASIYDAERGTIIEALTPVVREVPLKSLVGRNRILIVVRPSGQTAEMGKKAVERARSKVGAEFDVAGLVGLGDESRFYCSELVAWASGFDTPQNRVITPPELIERGEVVYLSGNRNDPSLQAAAKAHVKLVASRERKGNVAAKTIVTVSAIGLP